MHKKLRYPLVVACVLALVAGCSTDGKERTNGPSQDRVGRFASPNPGSVNTYWVRTQDGLVVFDTLRTLTDARNAVQEIRRTGKPVVAILLTHSHPDHVGGAGVFHAAYPKAPIYASEATATMMRADKRGFYPLTRSVPNADFPAKLTYPDRTFAADAPVQVGGIRLETLQIADGESDSATVYYRPDTGDLFSGDLTGNRVTPALIEGHTCGWLQNIDRFGERFPDARTMYPGHGAPGTARALIDAQREYLRHFRRLVRTAIAADSPKGRAVSPGEDKSITAEMERAYPGYPPVASLPNLIEVNIKAVARELATENPAKLPGACADTS